MTRKPLPSCSPDQRGRFKEEHLNDGSFIEPHPIHARVVRSFLRDDKKWEERICKNCGGTFECLANSRRDYGDDPCRMAFLQRRQRRGLMAIDALMRYRRDRKDKTALGDLCQIAGLFIAEDRAVGRPSW